MHPRSTHTWHPCTQMKDHENYPLLNVVSASGCYLTLDDGRKLFDGISSWWCKSLGHGHPYLRNALEAQLNQFEHVILAGTTNATIQTLSARLASLMPALDKVFYASDGSSAVEIAMKMSIHVRKITGDHQRTQFLALGNGYHGETIAALSVSDLGIYRDPYVPLMFPAHFLKNVPYVSGKHDPLWHDCSFHWQCVLPQLEQLQSSLTAIIVEPIVQGAGGMKIYSQDFLRRLRQWSLAHDIHFIADEIMTGIGRTGKMLACEHADIEPDFLCLSKGLTSGWLPLSAMLTSQKIFDYFYADYSSGKSFLHSHTYTGNALAASVAIATLEVMENEKLCLRAEAMEVQMRQHLLAIAERTKYLANVRSIGAIAAADIKNPAGCRLSMMFQKHASDLGVLLRPLGDTIYWLPPLIANENDLLLVADCTEKTLNKIFEMF